MIGMDRRNGQPLSGLAHLKQSIEDILGTPLGSNAALIAMEVYLISGRKP